VAKLSTCLKVGGCLPKARLDLHLMRFGDKLAWECSAAGACSASGAGPHAKAGDPHSPVPGESHYDPSIRTKEG
jgi:hypothetical protein